MGMITVLHTWGQNLSLHPHLHCIVPAGGVDQQQNWKEYPTGWKIPVSSGHCPRSSERNIAGSSKKGFPWNMRKYAKHYGTRTGWYLPKDHLETAKPWWSTWAGIPHKIAISSHRIKAIGEEQTSFAYKDYRQGGISKNMTLAHAELIRQFALHIFPKNKKGREGKIFMGPEKTSSLRIFVGFVCLAKCVMCLPVC